MILRMDCTYACMGGAGFFSMAGIVSQLQTKSTVPSCIMKMYLTMLKCNLMQSFIRFTCFLHDYNLASKI